MVLLISAGAAVFISLVDFTIEQVKKHRREMEIRNMPAGTPIIIRKPLYKEEGTSAQPESPENAEALALPMEGSP